ncbi:MAG: hypothetical protein ABFD92_16720 [Planctomycetaceae bacterium]|nr:hypothetical protein [Planctomycetaceae bacterium]
MSFSLTEAALIDGSKTVTRRLGWQSLRCGDYVRAVRKAMGLKKGERVFALAVLRIISARREPLNRINRHDVKREGFPQMSPDDFVAFFVAEMRCPVGQVVTRIEFEICRCRTCGHFSREFADCGNCSAGPLPSDVVETNFCSDWSKRVETPCPA